MQQVAIIGLGLIGGSLGLGLRRWSAANGSALHVVGFDEDIAKQRTAKGIGAVDAAEWSLVNAVSNADVVVVATPVGSMRQVFEDIGPHLKAGAVVTDTGSTKVDVLEWATALPDHVDFVGGHPMAGRSEGLEAASADLFAGATWVVCPSITAAETSVRTVLGIIAAVGAETFFVDPIEHDSYVAGISHLPFVAAATLMRAVAGDPAWRDIRTLSASGLRDTTRLALGSPEMHRDILLSNREAIARWIDTYITALDNLKAELGSGDEATGARLLAFLREAQNDRASLETPPTRSSEQAAVTGDSVASERVSDQVGRMFLGGFGRRRREPRRSND